MPTNLPPEYFDAEKNYKEAQGAEEKITCLEELIRTIPTHKGTDRLRADYRRRLSKLKAGAQSNKGSSRHKSVFKVEKEGCAQVAVIGTPNVGKSSLVAAFTNAAPQIGNYPFTTQVPLPGIMDFKKVHIQLIDTPPLSRQHIISEVFDLIRGADLILLLVDLLTDPLSQISETMELLIEKRIYPPDYELSEEEEKRGKVKKILVVANKDDDLQADENLEIFLELLEMDSEVIAISLLNRRNLDLLKDKIYNYLNIIRVYSKATGKPASMDHPFVLKKGETVQDFCRQVHKDFAANLKVAKAWGTGVFDGQKVHRDHVLHDGDIVELHL